VSRPFRRKPVLAVLAAAVVGTFAAGCASIPGSSRPQIISESIPASPPSVDGDPRYDPIVPRPGERPEDIVRDYLAVGGSLERKHARARAYLSESSARTWDDNDGAIVLEDSVYLDVRRDGAEVSMRAQQRGRLDADGTYLPNAAPYPYTFQLEKNPDGQWRIGNPPPGVFVRAATFEDVYRSYNVYFLDSTRRRVVPDVRWFAAPQDSLPSVLVSALERGPSESLRRAVRSDLEDAKLQSNVVRESDRVRVYLTGLADRSDPLPPGGFAQLVWTLNQFGVGGVEIYSDGQLLQSRASRRSLQRFSDWRAFDPDALSATAPGYFVRNGAVWTTANSPAPGPAGRGDYAARAVAVSINQRSMAVVGRGPGGRPTLFVGPARGTLRRVLTGASLTPPSWGADTDEVWTVLNGREVVLVPTGGEATPVVVPALDRIGAVRVLRLSRDGTRVALVAGPAGRERLHLGVVTRENGAARVDDLLELDVGEGPVSDVSWSTALDLVALVRGGQQDSGLYAMRIDGVTTGRLVSTSGLPGPPSAVAAAPALPLLTIAAGDVWRTLASNEPWTRVTRDASPGSAPAYPG